MAENASKLPIKTEEKTPAGSASARVTVSVVEGANHPPKAMDDTATTTQGRPVTINVVANDTDADGDTLTAGSVTQPSNGTAVTNGNGTCSATPFRMGGADPPRPG